MAGQVDWSSDGMIFLSLMLLAITVVAVALERHSPRRKERRRVDKHHRDQAGELID